jgi:hypothetical protein
LLLIVSVEEGEVLIQRFGSIKKLKVIFGNYKAIEFIIGKWLGSSNLSEEFVEITERGFAVRKFNNNGDRFLFIEDNITCV